MLSGTLALAAEPVELLEACEKADVNRVRLLLNDTDPNVSNARGETPLMLAAKAGHFEICRALLWAGARADAADKSGKKVRDHLKGGHAGYSPLNLLLRCYAFVQPHGTPAAVKPAKSGMVIISDSFIDHQHPELKARYWTNKAEAGGKPGVDDDKNGFIDDVYGWNANADEPLRAPLMADFADEVETGLLRRFVTLYNRGESADFDGDEWKDQTLDDLEDSYENPLVRRLGFDTLIESDVDIDDRTFTHMLVNASHGTHVAGIVLKNSGGKALLHGMMHGRFAKPKEADAELTTLAHRLAPRTISYEQFLLKLRQTLLDEATHHGQRRSAYLRATGAGVVNLSWCQSKKWHLRVASEIKDIYAEHGMDPDSIARYVCPLGLDLCGDLGFELLVNAAAELALMFYENPDVLFVIAAGNESEDNDGELPSPAYLSRFFPNVITVASVNDEGTLSEFSNYGPDSVQVAAPGEKILSTLLAGQKGLMSGTSMAAPAVSGIAARIRAERPALTAADVRLILERSVQTSDELESRVASGGVVDAEAALALATEWQPGSRADLTLAALAPTRRKADEDALAGKDADEDDGHDADPLAVGADAKGARITAIGGFANQWHVIMSSSTDFPQQVVHPVGELPIGWIKDKWDDGWEITSIGGENEHWRVVMSRGAKNGRTQKLLGLDFDSSSLDDLMSIGWHITGHAGYSSSWVFVLTENTGWKEQVYTRPGPFDAERQQWIQKHLAEGYRITSLAGDNDDKDHSKDGWSVVMTRGTNLGDQVFTGPAAWPESWIAEHTKKGFQVTHCSGFADHWVVVMTKGGTSTAQSISDGTAWDDEWLKARWKGKE